MKNFRKLVFASIMLVFALVAVVSSTVAWFTMQQEAQVNEMKLGAAADGLDLQIRTDTSGWGYTVDFNDFNGGKLTPVTFHKSDKTFNKLTYNSATDKMVLAEAEGFKKVASDITGEYVAFNLYFQSSNDAVTTALYLNTTGTVFETDNTDKTILSTIRTMFLTKELDSITEPQSLLSPKGEGLYTDGSTLIYEPNYTPAVEEPETPAVNGTYGFGNYFDNSKKYIAESAFSNYLTLAGDTFTMNTDYVTENKYSTKLDKDATQIYAPDANPLGLRVADIPKGKILQVTVYIWLEGWDGDTNNTVAREQFTALLKFTGK